MYDDEMSPLARQIRDRLIVLRRLPDDEIDALMRCLGLRRRTPPMPFPLAHEVSAAPARPAMPGSPRRPSGRAKVVTEDATG